MIKPNLALQSLTTREPDHADAGGRNPILPDHAAGGAGICGLILVQV